MWRVRSQPKKMPKLCLFGLERKHSPLSRRYTHKAVNNLQKTIMNVLNFLPGFFLINCKSKSKTRSLYNAQQPSTLGAGQTALNVLLGNQFLAPSSACIFHFIVVIHKRGKNPHEQQLWMVNGLCQCFGSKEQWLIVLQMDKRVGCLRYSIKTNKT